VRMLVPRHLLGSDPWTIANESQDMQALTQMQVGLPVQCPCGQTAIRYGDDDDLPAGFPWGKKEYVHGAVDDNRTSGQYCPRCDGGEDV